MGQYHYPCNMDRHEFLNPHSFGDGLKILEFAPSGHGTMYGLGVLLAASNKGGARGGGDLHPWLGGPGYEGREVPARGDEDALMQHIVGRWAGDRVAIIGDYAKVGDFDSFDPDDSPWSDDEGRNWTDISSLVVAACEMDFYAREDRKDREPWGDVVAVALDATTGAITAK